MVYYVHSIARKWNLEAAEQMLKAVSAKPRRTLRSETLKIATYSLSLSHSLQSLKTRAMWNVDNLEKWDAPQALREYLPYGLMGYDNDGSPGKWRDFTITKI